MIKRCLGLTLAATLFGAVMLAPSAVARQIPATRDFSGIWSSSTTDLTKDVLPGQEISFTKYGAERYKAVDMAKAPANICLPYGPTRAMQSTYPLQIVQVPNLMVVVFEHADYRLIYLDGRPHPKDVSDYPTWMGDSVGKWEGDTLVVDTVGINEGSWLDASGLEHSDKLRLTERFQKTGAASFKWTVTVDDPTFYTKPWTYMREFKPEDTRLMPAHCIENEKDAAHALPGLYGARHENKAVLKFPQ